MDAACRICGHADATARHRAREMMFGTREPFEYRECARCGCLQIAEIPADLSRHYPPEYYSHSARTKPERPSFRARMQRRVGRALLGAGPRPVGWLAPLWPPPPFVTWARAAGVGLDDPILDVGSGAGALLHRMASFGFSDLTGIDPYLEGEVDHPDGVRLRRRELAEEDGRYRLVMLHHALEHVTDPLATLRHAHRVLEPGGCCLVRVPVKDSAAWETYGVDWVQLDAPRHLHLFTEAGLGWLAGRAGLRVERTVRDASPFQFWGSELYRRDVPLRSADGDGGHESPRHRFSRDQLRAWRRETERLNRAGRGDSACFWLRRVDRPGEAASPG